MPAYNFLKCYAADVESGKKRCTIRRKGKRKPPVKGDEIKLFTGQRTKFCRLLRIGICTSVSEIKIIPKFGEVLLREVDGIHWVILDSNRSLEKLATEDGFKSVDDFFSFFCVGADEDGVFTGHLIEWEPAK